MNQKKKKRETLTWTKAQPSQPNTTAPQLSLNTGSTFFFLSPGSSSVELLQTLDPSPPRRRSR
jgi:hypothetical protein